MSAKWRATCSGMLQPMLSLPIARRHFLMRASEATVSVSGLGYLPKCAATLGRHARSCGVCTPGPKSVVGWEMPCQQAVGRRPLDAETVAVLWLIRESKPWAARTAMARSGEEKEKEGNCWRALLYCLNERESWHTPSNLLRGHVCLRLI